jgi:hypothetical protein
MYCQQMINGLDLDNPFPGYEQVDSSMPASGSL